MKTKLITLALVLASATAFAQGKITFVNDSLHLVFWRSPATPVVGGSGAGATLLVDLYGGPNAGSMTLQATTSLSTLIPGQFGPLNFTSTNLPGGVTAVFQVKVRENIYATAELGELAGSDRSGFSPIFTFKPSSTIAFNSIVNHGGTALSTWADGVYDLGAAGMGSIPVGNTPEPSTMAITILGLITCCISRSKSRQD